MSSSIRIIPPATIKHFENEDENIRKIQVGEIDPSRHFTNGKVLMLLGATGAGKSTLINGFVNYIRGVSYKDSYRYRLVGDEGTRSQAHSQTKWITAYTFEEKQNSRLPYTLTIIDTPGYGDTKGIERDKEITKQIKEFFSIRGEQGIDQIDGIGFVVQSPLARLTYTQRYIFDSILSMFGKDISNNIFMMVTFCDGKKPPVLKAIKKSGFRYKQVFKFNNSALFPDEHVGDTSDDDDGSSNEGDTSDDDDFCIKGGGTSDGDGCRLKEGDKANDDDCSLNEGDTADDDDRFNEMFWSMGEDSFQNFLQVFGNTESVSLQLTKEVLQERETLECLLQNLQVQIQAGLSKVDELHQEERILKEHEKDMETNKEFKYEIEETRQRKVDLPSGKYVTNCLKCNFTCHYPCMIAEDELKYNCAAMPEKCPDTSTCVVCPTKCFWKQHVNNPYKFEIYTVKVTKTSVELKKRYEDAKSKKSEKENIMSGLQRDLETMYDALYYNIYQAKVSIERLDEIALRPNPLTEVQYIDLMIEAEQMEAKKGFTRRIKAYKNIRKQAEVVSTIKDKPSFLQKCKGAAMALLEAFVSN